MNAVRRSTALCILALIVLTVLTGCASAGAQAPGATFAAAGDLGDEANTTRMLQLAQQSTDFFVALGDFSYNSGSGVEQAWCNYVKSHYSKPFQLIVGNHEDESSGDDGFIDRYAACLPDRMSSTPGAYGYGRQYYFDFPSGAPLARLIAIDPDVHDGGSPYHQYCKNETTNCNWLKARIDEAKAAGLWVIVAQHENCVTMGVKTSCEIGPVLFNNYLRWGVDLVLQGHDHTYQRSKQLALTATCTGIQPGSYNAGCTVDSDSMYAAGRGTALVISGVSGYNQYQTSPSDAEAGYFAVYMPNSNTTHGFTKVTVSPERLDVLYSGVGPGSFSDAFSIVRGTIPPPVTSTPTTPVQPTVAPTASPTAQATAVPTQPAPSGWQPSAPWHAVFYYPWFGNPATDGSGQWGGWRQNGTNPPATWFSHYLPDPLPAEFNPTTELYSSRDSAMLFWQFGKMAEARQEVAIASWWGIGTYTDESMRSIFEAMDLPANPYPNLRWALYYESESQGDPGVADLVRDLEYIYREFASRPQYFRIDGKPVVFVYADSADSTGMVSRWGQARAQMATAGRPVYIVLKVFPGHKLASPQPDGWHQYAPAVREDVQAGYSYAVSPGFWLDGASERLVRDLGAFQSAAQRMAASSVPFKLVTTWNEMGEGSGVEPAQQTQVVDGIEQLHPSGYPFGNLYVDALAAVLPPLERGTGAGQTQSTSTPTATPTSTPTATDTPTSTPTATATFTPLPPTATPTQVSPLPTPVPSSVSVPVADTYTNASSPRTNYGGNVALRVDNSPRMFAYVKFNVPAFQPGNRAILRLFANSGASAGVSVSKSAGTAWAEYGATFSNMAGPIAPAVHSGPFSAGTWLEFDVTSMISGPGLNSFTLFTPGNTAVNLSSRETSNSPQLHIGVGSATLSTVPRHFIPAITEQEQAKDSDGDGLPDKDELANNLSPTLPDSDGDGIFDLQAVEQMEISVQFLPLLTR